MREAAEGGVLGEAVGAYCAVVVISGPAENVQDAEAEVADDGIDVVVETIVAY